jgi:hypothetical protein
VYGEPQLDGRWGGWIVFFPLDRSPAIATDRETTQTTFDGLAVWAAGLTSVDVEAALVRALHLAAASAVLDQLSETEYAVLEDAEQLEAAAEVKRATADIEEAAAEEARADARIRRGRLLAESEIAAAEETTAKLEADLNERAARAARAVAADAARRSRRTKAEATRRTGTRQGTRKKK